jgi:hypothetical protein
MESVYVCRPNTLEPDGSGNGESQRRHSQSRTVRIVNFASRPSAKCFDAIERDFRFSQCIAEGMSHSVRNAAVSVDSEALDESNQVF